MFVFSKGKPHTFNPLKRKNAQVGKIKGGTFNQDGIKLSKRHKDAGVADESIKPNIFFYNVGMMNSSKDKFAFEHRAIFPEQLASDHIISWSNEGDLVYDPFMGSGTTAKMAILNKRNWIGSEISEEYCKIIERRITTAST
jgi:DNA modification methylase